MFERYLQILHFWKNTKTFALQRRCLRVSPHLFVSRPPPTESWRRSWGRRPKRFMRSRCYSRSGSARLGAEVEVGFSGRYVVILFVVSNVVALCCVGCFALFWFGAFVCLFGLLFACFFLVGWFGLVWFGLVWFWLAYMFAAATPPPPYPKGLAQSKDVFVVTGKQGKTRCLHPTNARNPEPHPFEPHPQPRSSPVNPFLLKMTQNAIVHPTNQP